MNTQIARLPMWWARFRRSGGAVVLQAVCVVCVLWAAASLAADQSLEDRFLKEAPAKWLEYRQILARHTEGRAKGTNANGLGDKKVFGKWERSFALNIDGDVARASVVDFENRLAQSVEAFNPDYRFRLTAGRGGQWTIDRLRTGSRAIPEDLIGRNSHRPLLLGEDSTFGSAIGLACVGQQVGGAWLPHLVAAPQFRLIRATPVEGAGGLVNVEFEFEPKELTGGSASARSGTLVLDSKRYWLIREADTEATFMFAPSEEDALVAVRGTLKIRNDFSNAKLPVPYVSHEVLTEACEKNAQGKPWKEVYVTAVEMHDAPKIDARQFTLSAYGLPEPAAKK
jgi:hypothetical protein